uniref:Uncharacterized protein n=1 Tax=Anguilla anguilla TaxID=7936 RepID=A0A0E9WUQ9_ANGAN
MQFLPGCIQNMKNGAEGCTIPGMGVSRLSFPPRSVQIVQPTRNSGLDLKPFIKSS